MKPAPNSPHPAACFLAPDTNLAMQTTGNPWVKGQLAGGGKGEPVPGKREREG